MAALTSLAQQLQQLTVPQTNIYNIRARRSLLFDIHEANKYDDVTIFDIGTTGFEELLALSDDFRDFKETLFSESASDVERAMLSKKENEKLDAIIEQYLFRLSPYLLLTCAHQTLEWLIRRFQVHDYNRNCLLQCALPHHDSMIFLRLMKLCTISETDQLWWWLTPLFKVGKPLNRQGLLSHCLSDMLFLQFICDTALRAVEVLPKKKSRSLQLMFSFCASVVCGTIDTCAQVTDEIVGRILPFVSQGLTSKDSDCAICAAVIVAQLSAKASMIQKATNIILKQLSSALQSNECLSTVLPTMVVVCQTQLTDELPSKCVGRLLLQLEKVDWLTALYKLSLQANVDQFLIALLNGLASKIYSSGESNNKDKQFYESHFISIINTISISANVTRTVLGNILQYQKKHNIKVKEYEKIFNPIAIALGERLRELHVTWQVQSQTTEMSSVSKFQTNAFAKSEIETMDMDHDVPEPKPEIILEFSEIDAATFGKLTIAKKHEKIDILIQALEDVADIKFTGAKAALLRIMQFADHGYVFNSIRNLVANDNVLPSAKKRKRRDSTDVILDEVPLKASVVKQISTILECLISCSTLKTANSAKISSTLFMLLRKFLLVDDKDSSAYLMQLVLSLLMTTLKDTSVGLKSQDFDVDALVQCIRTTNAPHVHQHTYQVLSVAAKLFKEDLVLRLMPVFSFMGKGLFRQDDSYTFEVIHRTIENVVPQLLIPNTSKLSETIITIFRDFVTSLPHIPEHRRINLLVKLVNVVSSVRVYDSVAAGCFQGKIINIENSCLYILVGLLVEYHVMHWEKPGSFENNAKDAVHPFVDFIVRLCGEFSPADNLFCLNLLLRYINVLPDELNSEASEPRHFARVFEFKTNTSKSLRHFKYEVLCVAGQLLSSSGLIGKLAEYDLTAMPEELVQLCEKYVKELLVLFSHATAMAANETTEAGRRYWKLFVQRLKLCLDKINALLPAAVALTIIGSLLDEPFLPMQRHALELLNAKLLQNPTPFTKDHVGQLSQLAKKITSWLVVGPSGHEQIVICQCAMFTIKLLVRVLSSFDVAIFNDTLCKTVAIVHNFQQCNPLYLSNAMLCLAELIQWLGVSSVSQMPTYINDLLAVLENESFLSENDFLAISAMTALQKIAERICQFLSSSLPRLLVAVSKVVSSTAVVPQFKSSVQHRASALRKAISTSLPGRVLVPAIEQAIEELQSEPIKLMYVLHVLTDHVQQCSNTDISELTPEYSSLFLKAFDFRWKLGDQVSDALTEAEDVIIASFTDLSMKLSENAFRPLIFKVIDWATHDTTAIDRFITLFRLTSKLYESFRGLFNLFASQLIKLAADTLSTFKSKKAKDAIMKQKLLLLRVNILDTIKKSCQYDDNSFVNRERFDLFKNAIVDQLDLCVKKSRREEITDYLSECVVRLASVTKDDSAWKSLNYDILMKTRHENAEVRRATLQVLENLYSHLGSEVTPIIAEAVPFLAELLEDENEEVEKQCGKVVAALESIMGESLQDYF